MVTQQKMRPAPRNRNRQENEQEVVENVVNDGTPAVNLAELVRLQRVASEDMTRMRQEMEELRRERSGGSRSISRRSRTRSRSPRQGRSPSRRRRDVEDRGNDGDERRDREEDRRRENSQRRKLRKLEDEMKKLKEKNQPWNKKNHEKQAEFNATVKETLVLKMEESLEEYFQGREVPPELSEVLEAGKKLLDQRERELRMADAASWLAVERYRQNPLCLDDADEKRWARARREAETEVDKKKKKFESERQRKRTVRDLGSRDGDYSRYKGTQPPRYGFKPETASVATLFCSGDSMRPGHATSAVSPVISGETATGKVEEEKTETPEESEKETKEMETDLCKDTLINIDTDFNKEDLVSFEAAATKLDRLEGAVNLDVESNVAEIFEPDENISSRLTTSLKDHISFWEESGSSVL